MTPTRLAAAAATAGAAFVLEIGDDPDVNATDAGASVSVCVVASAVVVVVVVVATAAAAAVVVIVDAADVTLQSDGSAVVSVAGVLSCSVSLFVDDGELEVDSSRFRFLAASPLVFLQSALGLRLLLRLLELLLLRFCCLPFLAVDEAPERVLDGMIIR
jgi:hypothetical protein